MQQQQQQQQHRQKAVPVADTSRTVLSFVQLRSSKAYHM
jgi:hypothetical protein